MFIWFQNRIVIKYDAEQLCLISAYDAQGRELARKVCCASLAACSDRWIGLGAGCYKVWLHYAEVVCGLLEH